MQTGVATKLLRRNKARFVRLAVAWLPPSTIGELAEWLDHPSCVLAFALTCRAVWHSLFRVGRVQQARAFTSMIARLHRGNTTLSVLQQSICIPYPVHDGAAFGTMRCQLPASVVLAAVSSSGCPTLQFAPDAMRACKHIVLAAVRTHGIDLQHASPELRADEQVVLAAVQRDGLALQFSSEELRASKLVVQTALNANGSALQYASDALRGSKDVLLLTTRFRFPAALQAAAPQLWRDTDIVARAALTCRISVLRRRVPYHKWDAFHAGCGALRMRKLVAARGSLLQFASAGLRMDRACVASAVKQNGLALAYAHPDYCDDFDIVAVAAQNNSAALLTASARLRSNIVLAAVALASDAHAMTYFSFSIQAHERLVLRAVRRNGNMLGVVGENARRNETIVLAAVTCAGLALQYAPSFQDDVAVVLAAVGQCGLAVQFASKALRGCRAVMHKAVQTDGLALCYAEIHLRDDHDIVLAAVRCSPSALRFASIDQRNKLDVVRAAVSQAGWTLRCALPCLHMHQLSTARTACRAGCCMHTCVFFLLGWVGA